MRKVAMEAARGERGVTMVELLVAALIFAIVGIAMGSLYASTQRSMDVGSAQAFVQQQGTLIQEELARQIGPARQLLVGSGGRVCGPTGVAAGQSLQFQRAVDDTVWCVFQNQYSGEPSLLHICRLAVFGTVADCQSGTRRAILMGYAASGGFQGAHVTAGKLGVEMAASTGAPLAPTTLRVLNTCFVGDTVPGCCSGCPAAQAYSVDIRFEVSDCTQVESAGGCTAGLRFGSTVTLRNPA
jgi:type II secretory pathway pseudopilin PulG